MEKQNTNVAYLYDLFDDNCSDTNTGREFLMSQHSNSQCDTYGWIMISTQNNCPFEANSGGKPAFLYSPGQTSSHFEQSK